MLWRRRWNVEVNVHETLPSGGSSAAADVRVEVTRLYETHAVGLIRLAVAMLGDRPSAEDAVQDAFCGLYRRFGSLVQPDRALQYVRASVLNGCRSQLRARQRDLRRARSGDACGPATAGIRHSAG